MVDYREALMKMPTHHHLLLGLEPVRVALGSQNQTWKLEVAEELIAVLESLELRKDRPVELVLFDFSKLQLQLPVAVEIMMAAE